MVRLALLGDPVEHSLSPVLHQAALRAAGIDGEYIARRVGPDGVAEAISQLRNGDLDGANVTMPYKQLAAELADTLGPFAARAVSVNTLLVSDGGVRGITTDVEGIRQAWGPLPEGPVLVLGAGGAAAAALLALEGRPLHVSARRPEASAELLERTGVEAGVVPWEEAVPGAVIVNATPLGMEDEDLPPTVLGEASGLLEMPYGASPTRATDRARELGIPVVEGIEMLVAQAALSFQAWTGLPAPLAAMRTAVDDDHSPESNL